VRRVCLLLLPCLFSLAAHARSVAFYYGGDWLPELAAFDVAVVEPRHGFEPARLRRPGFEPFAYVSVGELAADHPAHAGLPAACRLARNETWGGTVVDMARAECRRHWLTQVFEPLWARGWRGFFLDTLDSYRLASDVDAAAQQAGLATLVREMKDRHQEARLILNRGFEFLPAIAPLIEAVAAESLFGRYDHASRQYGEVEGSDRDWLLARLREVKDRYRLPVIVIDYAPPTERGRAREIAARIAALGFTPWVTDGLLTSLGVGSREAMPRTIALLYDGREAPDLNYLEAHRFLELPVQHLGYRLRYWDMNARLPEEPQAGRLAGIIVWGAGPLARGEPVLDWLTARRREGLPVLLLGSLPFDPQAVLGAARVTIPGGTALAGPGRGFEGSLPPRLVSAAEGLRGADISPWVETAHGVLAGRAPWGGFALSPVLVEALPGVDQYRWLADPFRLLREGLQLAPLPVPDVTTENGRRLLTIHVDGDGFVSRAELPGRPWGGQALLDFVRRHPLPHGISVIEGEIGPEGLYPQHSTELLDIARHLFALPWVEAASHSFSHPFRWAAAAHAGEGEGSYTLPIPGYTFDARREIVGSRDFVARLLPSGKEVRLFFWTGDCVPTVEQLRLAREAGLFNINGGNTVRSKTCPSLTCVAPFGLEKDGERQVYAPVSNENLYTNLWTGPFWGYRRVIETFEATEAPRRLKPVGIYYHFYSATKAASLAALEAVYGWAERQPLHPVFVSEYVAKVLDFFDYAVAREGHTWILRGRGDLRTVRLDDGAVPDLTASRGVAGFARKGEVTYVHLTGAEARLVVGPPGAPAGLPFLREANARLAKFERRENGLHLVLRGHTRLNAVLAAAAACGVDMPGRVRSRRQKDDLIVDSQDATATLILHCPRP
jgi:hypothetical protein